MKKARSRRTGHQPRPVGTKGVSRADRGDGRTGPARTSDGMRKEYELSGGVRGKYAGLFKGGANVVILAPDVAEAFPDSRSVNEALRLLVQLARRRSKKR